MTETTNCIACAEPMQDGQLYYPDVSGGYLHAQCCGPEPESYCDENGDPLKPGDPVPTPGVWRSHDG